MAELLGGTASNRKCHFCDNMHLSQDCCKFGTLQARRETLVAKGRCFCCFQSSHQASACSRTQDHCGFCRKSGHHISLCASYLGRKRVDRKEKEMAVTHTKIIPFDKDLALSVRLIVPENQIQLLTPKELKRIRKLSGAGVSISECVNSERLVVITGVPDELYDAIGMTVQTFHDDLVRKKAASTEPTISVTIPAHQCGSLIGKSGNIIKRIRDKTGALMQIGNDVLPNSTDRVLMVLGSAEQIASGILHIMQHLSTVPVKNVSLTPYRPNSETLYGPVLMCEDSYAYSLRGRTAIPIGPISTLLAEPKRNFGFPASSVDYKVVTKNMPHGWKNMIEPKVTKVAFIPNNLSGYMGRVGGILCDIRRLSGATVTMCGINESSVDLGRQLTVEGAPEAVEMARYLIHLCVELQKACMECNAPVEPETTELEPPTTALLQLLAQPSSPQVVADIVGMPLEEMLESFK